MNTHTPLPRLDEATEQQLLTVVEGDQRLRIVCLYVESELLQVVIRCADGLATVWMLETPVAKNEAIRFLQGLRDGENLSDDNIAIFMRDDLRADFKRLN